MREDSYGTYLIFYEDQEARSEVFIGQGGREAAIATYREAKTAWSCHLFKRIDPDAPVPESQVAVKALEWVKHNTDGTTWSSQVTIVGEYYVVFDGATWNARRNGMLVARCESSDQGKEAAQNDFNRLVRSALVNPL